MTTTRKKKDLQREAIIKVFNRQQQRFTNVIIPSGITVGIEGDADFERGITLNGPLEFKTVAAPDATSLRLYVVGSTLYFNGSEVGSGGGGAPTDAQYVTLATDSDLSNERVLTAGSNITITDAGAGGAVTIAASAGAGGWTDDGSVVRLTTATDSVGIGTTSPAGSSTRVIDVENTTASSATEGGNLRLSSNDGAAMADGHRLGVIEFAGAEDASNTMTVGARIEALTDAGWSASENGADLLFYTTDGNASQSEQMRILAGGNVGIGVADPDVALEVLSTTTQIKASYDANSLATITVADASHTTIATGESGNLTLDAAGDIVIDADGDQVSVKFGGAAGQIDFSNENSGDGIIRQMVDAKDLIVQQYDGTEVVRFTDNARVGIGAADPGALLEVRGPAGSGTASAGVLQLSTAETTVIDADQLGRIEFIAPKETSGTDAITVAGAIWAEADDTFDSSTNDADLVFATGLSGAATEKMRIASDGKIGIGVDAPAELLEIEDADGTATTLQISNSGAGDPQLAFALSGTKQFTIGVDDTDGDKFKLGTTAVSTNTVLTIDMATGGQVGFGTTSPAEAMEIETGYATTTLQLSNTATDGDPQLAFALSGTKKFTMGVDDGDSDKFKIGTTAIGTNTRLTINSGGDVGIATSSPMNRVQIDHAGSNGDDGLLIVRADSSTVDGNLLGGIGFDSTDGNVPSSITEAAAFIAAYAAESHTTSDKGGDLVFGTTTINENDDTASHEWMRILDSGKVGVGTSSPANRLQVDHTGADGDDGLMIVRADASTADGDLLGGIGFDSTDGNVPSSITEASAFIAAYAAEDHTTGDKGGDLVFGTTTIDDNDDITSHEWMRILDSGKVGIGTASPATTLHVKDSSPGVRIQREAQTEDGTLDFAGAAGVVGASITHAASTNDLVFSSYNGSSTEEILRLGSYYNSSNRQVILLSGSASAAGSMQPKQSTDINFFVSGAMGSKDSSTKGTAVFGGDVVISGTLAGGSPLRIDGGMEVTGTMELKPGPSGVAIVRNPHGPVKIFADTNLKLGTGAGIIDLLDLGDGAAGQLLLSGSGALAERSVELNSPGTLFFTGSVGGAYFKGPMDVDGTIVPGADNAYDLGSASRRYANIYTGDLHLQETCTSRMRGGTGRS